MDVVSPLVAVVVGVGIGMLSGMLGIGGGTVMVPVFKLGFGMTAIGATATSLFAIIPTAISGSVTHVQQKTCIPKLGVLAGVGGACLSPVGVYLASISPGWAIMLAAAVVIGYSSITMFRKALGSAIPSNGGVSDAAERPGTSSSPSKSSSRPEGRFVALSRESEAPGRSSLISSGELGAADLLDSGRYWLGLPIGAVAGLVAGYVGVGGGFLMVPLFLSLVGISMKKASGTSLLAIAILSIPGTIEQLLLGNVAIGIALAVVVGSIPGAALGARLVKRIPERHLRLAFAAILLVAAVLLVIQELGLL